MSQSARELVANVRHELAAVHPSQTCCRTTELDGLRDAGRRTDVAIARTLHRLSGDVPNSAEGGTPAERALRRAALVAAPRAPQHCRLAFLRGRLLARGSLSLASGRIHLEVVVAPDEAKLLLEGLSHVGFPGSLRIRRGRGVIVWKGRVEIFDLLRRLGAGSSVAEIEARGVLREVRGELNRSINAETANLKRTVRAGMRQAEAIQRLDDAGALDVSGHVRRVAEARRAHPDATIAELGERLHLTRSSVQRCLHWLERQAATLPRQALP
ncbi:MAG: DNA-binding protein WhiA [Candidatus Limnocylindrus sp.]